MIIVTGDEAAPGSASGCNAGMAHHFGTPALSVGLSERAKFRTRSLSRFLTGGGDELQRRENGLRSPVMADVARCREYGVGKTVSTGRSREEGH